MPRSLKVRRNCFETVKTALRNRGFLSQRDLSEDVGTALSTVSKFMNGGAVDRAIFEDICLRLGLDWRDVAAPIGEEQPPSNNALISENSVAATSKYCLDWGEAPRNSTFYGRTDELAQLEQWIVQDQCCLVSILGIGGAGKTALSVKLSEQICDRFDAVVWRSLRNAPPLQTLLADLILSFSNQQVTSPERLEAQISQLIEFLHERRCLLVLDNVESILQGGERAGHYQEGYESYDELFCRIADGQHGSCLILTSREQMRSLSIRIGDTAPVRSLSLHGLPLLDSKELLAAAGIADANQGFEQLVNTYSGNPLALKIVASTIRSTFGGNISQFLQQRVVAYGGIWDLLEQQFDRLSPLEQQVMYWLAINREWVSFEELREDWIPPVSQRQLLEALESLQGRLLIEVSTAGFTQQPVVMEYVTQKLIDDCYQEITTQTLNLFRSHALLKAQSQDYVRDTQARLILQPLAQKLLIALTDQTSVAFLLSQLLDSLRRKPLSYTGYAAGNVINLLNILQVDLSDRDFSNLAIAQADLANTTLHRTNFLGSTLHQSNFTEVFGGVISVAFSPDGGRLAASDARGEIHLWQLHTQQKLLTLSGHKSWIFSFVFSPSGKTLASASDDFVIKLWDLATGQCLQTVKGPANILHAVTFSPDEQSLVWNNEEPAIQLWNIEYPEQQIASLQGYTLLARSTAFSPDGQYLSSRGGDHAVKLWDLQTGQCLKTLQGYANGVTAIALSSHPSTEQPILASAMKIKR